MSHASHDEPDGAEFRQLFDRLFPAVVCFFQRQGFEREESRDLAQETFLRVHRGMGGFRQESRIETWLFKIARNIAHNARRHDNAVRRQHEEVSLEDLLEQGAPVLPRATGPGATGSPSDPLTDLLENERALALRQAVEELPPKMRQVLLLRVDQNLKYREIATLLEVSIETVKAHLHQAKSTLIARLGSPLEPAEERRLREEEEP